MNSGSGNNRVLIIIGAALLLAAISFRTPELGAYLSGGFVLFHLALLTPARRVLVLSVPAIATLLCFCGGFISAALVVAGGLLLCTVSEPEKPSPFPRLLLLMCAWVAAEVIAEGFRFFNAPFSIAEWILQSPRLCRQLELVSSFLLLNEVARRPAILRKCKRWVFPALGVTFLVMLAQLFFVLKVPGVPEFFGWGLSSFFAQQLRVSGTFVDPNSAGAVLAIVAGFFVVRRAGARDWIWGALALAALLLTGSRSGLMLVGVLFVAEILTRRSNSMVGSSRPRILMPLLAISGIAMILLVVANFASISVIESLPPGLARISKSVRYDTVETALFSRTTLWRAAFAQWTHAPLFGVGLDRYRELLPPFAQALEITIGAWNDNPGSWPVFLLVELGLIGVLVFALDLRQLSMVRGTGTFILAACVALLIGCHTHAPLVAILYGAIAAFGIERHTDTNFGFSFFDAGVVLVAAPFIALIAMWFPRGVYLWEMQDGLLVRWTGSNAVVTATCRADGIVLRRLAPPGLHQRVSVVEGDRNRSVDDGSTSPLTSLNCNGPHRQSRRSQVHLHVSPTWIPNQHGVGDDPRPLGVVLEYPQPIDLDGL